MKCLILDDEPLAREILETYVSQTPDCDLLGSFGDPLVVRPLLLAGEVELLLLDIRMPGTSGIELQEQLADAGVQIPIIFITGHGSIPLSVKAMKAGAVDFIEKPFEDQKLIDAIHAAIAQNKQFITEQAEINELQQRIDSLTPREHEVFMLVVSGMLNKQIAFDLGMSEKTVKVHRARVMHKMTAASLADLVRMAEKTKHSDSRRKST